MRGVVNEPWAHGHETRVVWSSAQSFFFLPRGDLGSPRLVSHFSGLVVTQNGATFVWLQPKIRFFLPLIFSGEVTSDQHHKQEHNHSSGKLSTDHRRHKLTIHHCSNTVIVQETEETIIDEHMTRTTTRHRHGSSNTEPGKLHT